MPLLLFKRKEDIFDYTMNRTCKSCGHDFQGKFCPRCGEKIIEPQDRSVKNFLAHVFNAFTFIDGKFARSLKRMIASPGSMSADISIGISQPYMKPVAFFFVGNFIYFLFPLFQSFTTTLYSQMSSMPYSAYSTAAVKNYLAQHNLTLEAFSPLYNAASTSWSKLLLILFCVILFPFMVIINYTRKNYLSDHFLVSMEYSSFLIFVPTILLSFVLYLMVLVGSIFSLDLEFIFQDQYSSFLLLGLLMYFQFMIGRNFYQFPLWRRVVNTALVIPIFYMAIHVYRFILFLVTMASI